MAKSSGRIQWTGKNLADVKAFHKQVAHYPENPKAAAFPRDWSQHPDNLHVASDEGHTLIVGIGDALVRDAQGRLTVEKGNKTPRKLSSPGTPGRTHQAEASDGIGGGDA